MTEEELPDFERQVYLEIIGSQKTEIAELQATNSKLGEKLQRVQNQQLQELPLPRLSSELRESIKQEGERSISDSDAEHQETYQILPIKDFIMSGPNELPKNVDRQEGTGLGHEPRSLTPDYKSPVESDEKRSARSKALLEKFGGQTEEQSQKPKIDPPKQDL